MNQQTAPVVFDVSSWRGSTIIKGSDEFFRQLSALLQLNASIADDNKELIADIESMISKSDEETFFNDWDDYCVLRYNFLNQLTMTKRFAFELGESIFASLKKASPDTFFVNTIFAFAKKLQAAAVNSNQSKNERS